jgi:hypothetical protein
VFETYQEQLVISRRLIAWNVSSGRIPNNKTGVCFINEYFVFEAKFGLKDLAEKVETWVALLFVVFGEYFMDSYSKVFYWVRV